MKWSVIFAFVFFAVAFATAIFLRPAGGQLDFGRPANEGILGCAESGPCLYPPAPLGHVTGEPSGGAATVCVAGVRLGSAGVVLLEGEEVEPSSYRDDEVCFALAGDALRNGRFAVVRSDGIRSNDLPLAVPPSVSAWDVPSPLRPGDSIFAYGENLRYAQVGTSGAVTVRSDDDRVELFFTRSGSFSLELGGVAGPEVEVEPVLERSCSAGPRTTCSLVVNHVGSAARVAAATVGGLAATVRTAEGTYLELEWPEGLEPGVHALEVEFTDGPPLTGEVELTPTDSTTLVELSPFVGQMSRRAAPLFEIAGSIPLPYYYHFRGTGIVMYGGSGVALVPDAPTSGAPTREGTEGFPRSNFGTDLNATRHTTLVGDGNRLVVLGSVSVDSTFNLRGYVLHLDEDGVEIGGTREAISLGTSFGAEHVVAARLFGDDLLVAIGNDGRSSGIEARFAIRNLSGVPTSRTVAVDPAFSAVADDGIHLDTRGSWLSETHAFFTTCASRHRPAGITVAPLTVGASEITVGPPTELRDDADDSRHLLACHGTSDGLYWVERDATGDHLYFSDGSAPSLVFTLPESLPGVGDRLDLERLAPSDPQRFLSGILGLEALPGGRFLFLMAPRNESSPRVALYELDGAEVAHLGDVPVKMRAVLGDQCVSPYTDNVRCPGVGLYGCNLFACDVGVPLPTAYDSVVVHEGELLTSASGDRVHVVIETHHPDRPLHATFDRAELQHHVVPLP